jgi:predicted RNase H-like HicB family nuclease
MNKETLNITKTRIKGKVSAVGFNEGNSHIIYVPSLQLSSYGDTIKEARKMIKIVLQQFSKDILTLNEDKIQSVLADLGWERNQYFKKRMVNLSETTFEDIKKQFNLPDETEVEQMSIAV